ncbi:hypothetical protein RND81_13G130600 [Saponaria officinalis]|uniref:Uncharacterized protein n=1 Tax=Saponaria officinalis TaxID=3572 RepID=A0AAW1GZD8_SAPOF
MQKESRNSGASSSLSSTSPSFTTDSSETLADIAARVLHELNLSLNDLYDDDFYDFSHHQNAAFNGDGDDDDDVESEFEFAVISGNDMSNIITADEIFYDGKIKPIYPVFGTNLTSGDQNDVVFDEESITTSLEERERRNDNTWAPKKSKSTGTMSSQKRWRFKDLIHRSNSDGNRGIFVISKKLQQQKGDYNNGLMKRREKVSAVNNYYGYNVKRKMITKSYLPYRKDLVGFSLI